MPSAAAIWARASGRAELADLGVGEVFEIASRRAPGTRQSVERIGDVLALAVLDLRRIADAVAQIVDGGGQRLDRHLEALLARPQQEVGDVGGEPEILAIAVPQAEGAGGILARQETLHGIGDAHSDVGVEVDLVRRRAR